MSLMEKMSVSDELSSGVNYSTADHEFNVNESTVDIK